MLRLRSLVPWLAWCVFLGLGCGGLGCGGPEATDETDETESGGSASTQGADPLYNRPVSILKWSTLEARRKIPFARRQTEAPVGSADDVECAAVVPMHEDERWIPAGDRVKVSKVTSETLVLPVTKKWLHRVRLELTAVDANGRLGKRSDYAITCARVGGWAEYGADPSYAVAGQVREAVLASFSYWPNSEALEEGP